MLEKILVTGFPHTGTTILRKIIRRSEEVIDEEKEEDMPSEEDHVRFRNWQTRQKFRCLNDPSRLNLMPEQVEKISQIKTISNLGYSME